MRDEKVAQEAAARAPRLEGTMDIEPRCAICGWPLAENVEQGCVRGNCSQRPWPPRFYDPERAVHEYGYDIRDRQLPLPAIQLENERLHEQIASLQAQLEAARAPREPLEPPPDHRECQNCGRITYEEQEEFCGWCDKLITVAAARSALPRAPEPDLLKRFHMLMVSETAAAHLSEHVDSLTRLAEAWANIAGETGERL